MSALSGKCSVKSVSFAHFFSLFCPFVLVRSKAAQPRNSINTTFSRDIFTFAHILKFQQWMKPFNKKTLFRFTQTTFFSPLLSLSFCLKPLEPKNETWRPGNCTNIQFESNDTQIKYVIYFFFFGSSTTRAHKNFSDLLILGSFWIIW